MLFTKKTIRKKFEILCKQLNKTIGFKKGDWNLDINFNYGGYIIVEFLENGGEHHPVLSRRLSTREMDVCLDALLASLRIN